MIVSDAMGRIDEVLGEKPLSESPVNNIPSDNSIVLEHVTYSYDGEKNALKDVSLPIKAGTDNRISRRVRRRQDDPCKYRYKIFLIHRKGRILIGNIDIREIPKETLMNKVSFVFQNSRLIKASILENVRMAKPSADAKKSSGLESCTVHGYYRKITKWHGYVDRHKRRIPVRRRTAENSNSPC